jgi:hypothetical protein
MSQSMKTIWTSDGTDGPVLICPPPNTLSEIDRLRAINAELVETLQAVAALADGQGRLNLMEVAGQARDVLSNALVEECFEGVEPC